MDTTIEVTVDKSHLITIGERLYGESIELIRELVNNAYDADATEVYITVKDYEIIVRDNGTGMDLDGLKQYFNIGSSYKKLHQISPKYNRQRIGEFGIGKFSILSAASYFEVWTKKGNFQAKVVFDKEVWEKEPEKWQLPLVIEPVESDKLDGTIVTIKKVAKKFNLEELQRRLIESVPIKAPNFTVYLNNKKISPRYIPGHHIPFLEGTKYGVLHGEIIISSLTKTDIKEAGIECKVRGVTIKREFFGLEKLSVEAARITGEVNCDFLPITTDRTDFIKDSAEYKAFYETMLTVAEKVGKIIGQLNDYKKNRRTSRVLKEVIENIKKALILNPEYCPEGFIPIGEEKAQFGSAGYISETAKKSENLTEPSKQKIKQTTKQDNKKKQKPQLKQLTPTAVIKRLSAGQRGISCCIDHYGPDGPECITEGTVIYINRDHPIFIEAFKNYDTHKYHLLRLITQEISLMKEPHNPRQAFNRQSILLKSALIGVAKKFE